jgi:hypothetical protein
MTDLTACAAIYSAAAPGAAVPVGWLGSMLSLFSKLNRPIREVAYGTQDEQYNLLPFPASLSEVEGLIARGRLNSLDLYSAIQSRSDLVSTWDAKAHYDAHTAVMFLALDSNCSASLEDCLTSLYSSLTPGTYYGIAYHYEPHAGADFFATGTSFGDIPPEDPERLKQLRAWSQDLDGPQRFLRGYFRDVYRCNLINADHQRVLLECQTNATGQSIGRITPLTPSASIWEVTEEEAVGVRHYLRSAARLITDG